MAVKLDIHPDNPQARYLAQAADVLRQGGIVIYPTDSCYALACHLEDKQALDRIRKIRNLDKKHDFTLVCRDLKELSMYAQVDNSAFRLLKSLTPGPYTFLLKATRDVPRRLQHPHKKTIGLRVPANRIALELLETLNEPLMSTSLIPGGQDDPLSDPDDIIDSYDKLVDLILLGGAGGFEQTTVLDMLQEEVQVVREGRGDISWLV